MSGGTQSFPAELIIPVCSAVFSEFTFQFSFLGTLAQAFLEVYSLVFEADVVLDGLYANSEYEVILRQRPPPSRSTTMAHWSTHVGGTFRTGAASAYVFNYPCEQRSLRHSRQ
jgi:hypothetical protein